MDFLRINNYTTSCKENTLHKEYGTQNCLLDVNKDGIPYEVLENKVSFKYDGYIDTLWGLNEPYSIKYNIILSNGTQESRMLTKNGDDVKYYINGELQDDNPQVPTDSILDKIAYIGNTDDVSYILPDFTIYNKIIEP